MTGKTRRKNDGAEVYDKGNGNENVPDGFNRAKRRKKNDGEAANDSNGNGDVEESLLAEGKESQDEDDVILESDAEASKSSRSARKSAARTKSHGASGAASNGAQSDKSSNIDDEDFDPSSVQTPARRANSGGRNVNTKRSSNSRQRVNITHLDAWSPRNLKGKK